MAETDSTPLEISSVEDGVYRALRQEIGRLDLLPGQRLPLEEIAGRFQVSLTPVRHALRRLESEGLVVSLPRRGSRVAPLSVEELEEIQALRLGLETFLGRSPSFSNTDFVNPYVHQFSLGMQRELPWRTTVELGMWAVSQHRGNEDAVKIDDFWEASPDAAQERDPEA